MSGSTENNTPLLTAKEALQNIHKWSLHAPRKNKWSQKLEAPVLYDGQVVAVQIGSPKHPIYCPFGLSRWHQGTGKFVTVENALDTQWMYQAQEGLGNNRRMPSAKLQAMLTLHEWDTEGTQGYYTYNLILGVIDRIVQGLTYGVPDLNQLDADGQPTIVPAADIAKDIKDPAERERVFRKIVVTPVQEPTNGYAPNLKPKVRAVVRRDNIGEFVSLEMDLLDANSADHLPIPPREHLDFFKKGCRGVFVIKFNPITYKRNEINMTIDIVQSMIKPTESLFKKIQMKFDEDDDQPMGDE